MLIEDLGSQSSFTADDTTADAAAIASCAASLDATDATATAESPSPSLSTKPVSCPPEGLLIGNLKSC